VPSQRQPEVLEPLQPVGKISLRSASPQILETLELAASRGRSRILRLPECWLQGVRACLGIIEGFTSPSGTLQIMEGSHLCGCGQ
jgi:hypothetical protein